ncbi:MAG: hypothetical protein PF961_08915 [Planctomycetota bacterium]|jgi:hypothetical protein|nr:hypothetical protein [Planctomycetota bacterium]
MTDLQALPPIPSLSFTSGEYIFTSPTGQVNANLHPHSCLPGVSFRTRTCVTPLRAVHVHDWALSTAHAFAQHHDFGAPYWELLNLRVPTMSRWLQLHRVLLIARGVIDAKTWMMSRRGKPNAIEAASLRNPEARLQFVLQDLRLGHLVERSFNAIAMNECGLFNPISDQTWTAAVGLSGSTRVTTMALQAAWRCYQVTHAMANARRSAYILRDLVSRPEHSESMRA